MNTISEADLEKVFHQVTRLVQQSPASTTSDNSDNDTKLKLYGLYKHVHEGPCSGGNPPTIFQPVARSKYHAWESCQGYTRREAMEEYVQIMASRDDELGDQCKALLESLNTQHDLCTNPSVKVDQIIQENAQEECPTTSTSSVVTEKIVKQKNPATEFTSNYGIDAWIKLILECFGIRPLIPRGILDISFTDLMISLCECITCLYSVPREQELLSEISKMWRIATNSEIAIGLSVRTIFDVYLCSKGYPPESEVIVFPPISVPGMMYVAKHHKLKIVPVDIGETQWWNLEAIQKSITKRTVAIMVVHPFGAVATSAEQLECLRGLADEHQLELWEDCAECFMGFGKDCYMGNPIADVRFFSFGQIKTATALGGGVAVFRDAEVGRHIQQLCIALPQLQTNFQFFRRVLLSIILNFIGSSPIRVGILQALCSVFFLSYSTVVTRSIRGFRTPDQSSMKKATKQQSRHIEEDFTRQIRKRPSIPLLKLLLRRFRQSTQTAPSLTARLSRCRKMKSMLQSTIPEVLISNTPEFQNTYWIFPIKCVDRDTISLALQHQGFDVVSGASQLCCVAKFTDDDRQCPRSHDMMESILYLPIASQEIPDMDKLVKCLKDAIVSGGKCQQNCEVKPSKTSIGLSATLIVIALSVYRLSFGISLSIWFLKYALMSSTAYFILLVPLYCFSLGLLRYAMASFYLNETTAFAEHCEMVDAATFDRPINSEMCQDPVETFLCSIDALKLPHQSTEDSTCNKVILTGSTGFVGSLILKDLLFHRHKLSLSGGVIVICRRKGTKSARTRITELLASPMYSFLSDSEKESLVEVFEGDVTEKLGGLCDDDLNRVCRDVSISHVFHCAAAVGFTQSLPDSARSNITSSLNMQSLAARLPNKAAIYVHISTAFVHGGLSGSQDTPLPEELYSMSPFDPAEIYRSMTTSQFYASKAMVELDFPNTYTFSKCVCEHLLLSRQTVNTLIIRPNIVGPAVENPFEAWAGKKPSTIVAGASLHLSTQWNLWCLERQPVSCIPVDVLSRFVLAKAFQKEDAMSTNNCEIVSNSDSSFERISRASDTSSDSDELVTIDETNGVKTQEIYNATWDASSSENKCFSWLEFSVAYLQLGCILGYFNRTSSYLTLIVSARIIPQFFFRSHTYKRFHYLIVRFPVELLLKLYDIIGLQSGGVAKVVPFLDLPLLFYPFVKKEFFFRSEIVAPETFNAKRYLFSCGVAAHRFISQIPGRVDTLGHVKRRARTKLSTLVVGGKCHNPQVGDLQWVLSQPRGSFMIRLAAYCFIKILRMTCSAVTVDVASFRHALSTMKQSSDKSYLVLAPTHRSFFDFVLLSFVLFSLPELHIKIPFIVAATDFEQLPVIGWLARLLGAFYVRRGRGFEDQKLASRLEYLKETMLGGDFGCFAVFLEGTRSRDRRFIEPKTGFLKSLKQSGGEHVVVPITINYESIPEHQSLLEESIGQETSRMSTGGFLRWLKDVIQGKVYIGKVHIVAADALSMQCESSNEFKTFGKKVQQLQRDMVMVSEFHVAAAANFFQLDPLTIRGGIQCLGCKFWPEADIEIPCQKVQTLADDTCLFSIILQFSHNLAPMFLSERPKWAYWLHHDVRGACDYKQMEKATQQIYNILLGHFDYADAIVSKAFDKLYQRGFRKPQYRHVLQVALTLNKDTIPQIVKAATSMQFPNEDVVDRLPSPSSGFEISDFELHDSSEKLGYWGFHDSGFVVTSNACGDRIVTMQGSRYSLAGRNLAKILPFIESEMQVKLNMLNEFRMKESTSQNHRPSGLDGDTQQELLAKFRRVSFATIERIRHGTGHSQEDVYGIREGCNFRIPDAVVWPESEHHVEELVDLAKERKWCLIPFGGGTNVTCATRCPKEAVEKRPIISVDMKLLRRVLWLNGEDGLARIEAGITGRDLVEELHRRGYTMGHEPDSIEFSTLGGWIATKASGMKRSKYGNIEDIVKDVRVVGDELVWKGGCNKTNAPGRAADGMDVLSIMLGSEGCLGIITSAVIRIWPLPEVKEFDSIIFPCFQNGLSFTRSVGRLGGNSPASVRLLDNSHFRLGQALRPTDSSGFGHLKDFFTKLVALSGKFDASSIVCATITYEGSKNEVAGQKQAIQKIVRDCGGMHLGASIGKSGYDLTFMIAYLRDFALTYRVLGESFETFMPWSKIEKSIEATKNRIIQEHQSLLLPGIPFIGCRVTQLYHEGACLYFYLCISIDGVENGSEVFTTLEAAAREEIIKHGGSLSHHHGIGKIRAPLLKGKSSDGFKKAMESLKKGMDSDNIFGARNGLFADFTDQRTEADNEDS